MTGFRKKTQPNGYLMPQNLNVDTEQFPQILLEAGLQKLEIILTWLSLVMMLMAKLFMDVGDH